MIKNDYESRRAELLAQLKEVESKASVTYAMFGELNKVLDSKRNKIIGKINTLDRVFKKI